MPKTKKAGNDSGYGVHHLCNWCSARVRICITGRCSNCPRYTSYSSYSYCVVCAKEKNCCNGCGQPTVTHTKSKKKA